MTATTAQPDTAQVVEQLLTEHGGAVVRMGREGQIPQDAFDAAQDLVGALTDVVQAGRQLETDRKSQGVLVAETGNGKFEQSVLAGQHRYLADEPVSAGGNGNGPSPYDYLIAALGACSVKEEKTVQQPSASAPVSTAPAGTTTSKTYSLF